MTYANKKIYICWDKDCKNFVTNDCVNYLVGGMLEFLFKFMNSAMNASWMGCFMGIYGNALIEVVI